MSPSRAAAAAALARLPSLGAGSASRELASPCKGGAFEQIHDEHTTVVLAPVVLVQVSGISDCRSLFCSVRCPVAGCSW